jgi:hypothetical protein
MHNLYQGFNPYIMETLITLFLCQEKLGTRRAFTLCLELRHA